MALRTLALLLLFAPLAAQAQTYTRAIDPPGNPALWGLEFHDGQLYATDTNPDRLLQVDLATGAVTSLGALAFDPRGLAWDGTNYRISTGFDTSSPLIYTVSPTGTTLGQIPAPSALTHGLALHDGRLFASKAYPDNEATVVGIDPATGAVLETIPFPSTQPGGLAFVDTNTFWISNVGDDSGSSGVYVLWKMDRTGAVLDTLAVPPQTSRPRGVAYDGTRYLYVVVRQDVAPFEYVIYEVDLQADGNPTLAVSADSLNFGERVVGPTYPLPLTLQNTGDAPLTITNVVVEGPDEERFATTLTPTTIPAGGSLDVTVSFNPIEYGRRRAFLRFETNDVQAPVVIIPLNGVGLNAQPTLAFVEASHDFGPVRIEPDGAPFSSVLWPLLLENRGAQPLTVTGITYDDPAFSTFAEGALPVTIAPFDTATVRIEFRPTEVRAYAATASVASNDPAAPTRPVALAGAGINPALEGGDVVWAHTVPENSATSSSDRKVFSLKVMGDVTGDGVPDLVYASRNYFVVALDGNGWGQPDTLWTFNTCPNNNDCGAVDGSAQLHETGLEAGRDFNGDGIGDVVFGTGGGNDAVVTLDGRTGEVIWQINNTGDPYLAAYSSVSARLDVNIDGEWDVATGTGSADLANSPNPYNHRRVYLLDGGTGAVLWEQPTALPNFRTVGLRLMELPGSGDQLIVTGGGEGGTNFLSGYRSGNGALLWTLNPSYTPFVIEPFRLFGTENEDFVAAGLGSIVQRITANGTVVWTATGLGSSVWDLVVLEGDPAAPSRRVIVGSTRPDVVALDGQTGAEVWTYPLGDQVFDVGAVYDMNGDFVDEVAATGKSGRTVLLDGATGALLWEHVFGDGSFAQSGEVVIGVPDVDGNGVPEVAFGTRDGRVRLLFGGGATVPTADGPTPGTPLTFALDAAYPNPFNPTTTLRFTLDAAGPARLAVYDALGREVAVAVDARLPAGAHTARFDAQGLASGVYFVRLVANGQTATQTITLLK